MVSLVGRGQIADRVTRPHGPAERIRELRESQAENLAAEERVRRQKQVEADETEEEPEEDDEDEDKGDEKDDKKDEE